MHSMSEKIIRSGGVDKIENKMERQEEFTIFEIPKIIFNILRKEIGVEIREEQDSLICFLNEEVVGFPAVLRLREVDDKNRILSLYYEYSENYDDICDVFVPKSRLDIQALTMPTGSVCCAEEASRYKVTERLIVKMPKIDLPDYRISFVLKLVEGAERMAEDRRCVLPKSFWVDGE